MLARCGLEPDSNTQRRPPDPHHPKLVVTQLPDFGSRGDLMSEQLAAGVATRNPDARLGRTLRHIRSYQPRPELAPGDIAVALDEAENPFTVKVVDNGDRRIDASSLIQRRYA